MSENREQGDESEWRFDVDEVGEDGERVETHSIEPGSPRFENVAFFALGVCAMLGVIGLLIFG
ncbi:DUF7312 domain-containing protein [Halobacterium zhouii]|uniref:DUF7312 domain-containing protein n=1 Tax=Halobacterium zhouii TaxID=2902624 RepID=UPI001E453B72|nr:hypothetical protein [Halobacterium zhouii]